MATAKTPEELQQDIAAFKGYFGQLTSVINGIVSSATGAAVTGAAGPVGLALMFFQTTINGIMSAEMAKKMMDIQMKWQEDQIKSVFSQNLLAEEIYKSEYRKNAELWEKDQQSNILKAQLIHIFIALIVVVCVAVLFFVIMPKRK